jgi:aryl-alcohol dehydrogenase-like predicted oxidoreductase
MKRRNFIAATLAGTGYVLTSSGYSAPLPTSPDPFASVTLGQSGLKVSRVGLGTGAHGWMRRSNQTRMGTDQFKSLIRYAYDAGIRLFDLADLYGTHPDIIPALEGIDRNTFTIVTKIWWREAGIPEKERLPADQLVERFLTEIGTDYIDMVHLHCVTEKDWPKKLRPQMDLLEKMKEQGKIRAHGVSVHALPALEAVIDEPWVDAVHARVNPFGAHMDGTVDEVLPILEKIHAAGKGITGMKIIGDGDFKNDEEKKNESIHFAFNLKCLDAMVVGFEKAAEIDDFRQQAASAMAG